MNKKRHIKGRQSDCFNFVIVPEFVRLEDRDAFCEDLVKVRMSQALHAAVRDLVEELAKSGLYPLREFCLDVSLEQCGLDYAWTVEISECVTLWEWLRDVWNRRTGR